MKEKKKMTKAKEREKKRETENEREADGVGERKKKRQCYFKLISFFLRSSSVHHQVCREINLPHLTENMCVCV